MLTLKSFAIITTLASAALIAIPMTQASTSKSKISPSLASTPSLHSTTKAPAKPELGAAKTPAVAKSTSKTTTKTLATKKPTTTKTISKTTTKTKPTTTAVSKSAKTTPTKTTGRHAGLV